jgi:hypothetical protein
MSGFLHGQTSNDVSHQIATNEFTPYNPSQGILLAGPRITQLHIPNTGRTDFGPDVTPAIVHANIQAGQIAMQFGQNGQKYSDFPEEPYTVRLLFSYIVTFDSGNTSYQSEYQYNLKLNISFAYS